MKKSILLIVSLFFVTSLIFSQTLPPSFHFENAILGSPQVYQAVLNQDASLLRSESNNDGRMGQPLRIAVGIAAEISLTDSDAPLLRLASGEQIRRKAIYSPDAYGLILTFDELYIPEGGYLFVYTENREQIERFTHRTNPAGGAFATDIFHQDKIMLEYVESTISDVQPSIIISNIGYVYRSQTELRSDMSCFINVNCAEGKWWELQARGVVGLTMSFAGSGGGRNWYICSGSLINNVRQDATPFILTAYHCIEGYDNLTFSTMRFDFFKESTSWDCLDQSRTSTRTQTMVGATLLAINPIQGGSDGSLLKLVNPIPEDWPVFFNGWDATGEGAWYGASIHHPNGMVKKISTFNSGLVSTGNIVVGGNIITGADAYWRVNWAKTINGHSVTHGGSSGSPIFNQNGHIVGTLMGGSSSCGSPNNPDFYGKFSYHWNQSADKNRHFSRFLDPDNTGTLVLDGFDPHFHFSKLTPVALPASYVTAVGFTANWEELPYATGYFLSVFERRNDNQGSNFNVYVIENYDVGNVLSFQVDDLDFETRYFFTIQATDGELYSAISNEISVTTLAASTLSRVFVYGNSWNIFAAIPDQINIYNLMGQRLLTQSISAGKNPLPIMDFPSGVYFVRIGETVHKVLTRKH